MSEKNTKDLSKILGVEGEYRDINPDLINQDHIHYQRLLVPKRVRALIKQLHGITKSSDFSNTKGSDLLALAERADGSFWCINGQHHSVAAAIEGITTLRYFVFQSPGWEFEKQIFDRFQEWQNAK